MGGENSNNAENSKDKKSENESEESGESNESESLEKIKEEGEEEEKDDIKSKKGKKDDEKQKDKKDEKDDEKEKDKKGDDEKDEEEEEEDEEENDKKSKKKDTKKDKDSEKKETKSKKSIKVTNSILKKKKDNDDGYFSIEESSSHKQSEKNSSIKDSEKKQNSNKTEKSSFIDERKYQTNSSFSFSNKSKNYNSIHSNYQEIISTNSELANYPKYMDHNNKRADNRVFGEFNYTHSDRMYEQIQEKNSESEEQEEPYKELTLKEKIINEYERHKNYMDTNEKGVFAEINKKSYKNAKRYKYRKSLLLHEKEITCICSLSGKIKKIAYATSSVDKSIKLWNFKFVVIGQIKNLEWHSNFICEFDTTNLLSSESINIKMYDLMTDNYDCIRTFKDHIEDINCILPLIDYEEDIFIFMSGGKDKILRLWDYEMDTPMKYYEGHYDVVTHIEKIANDNKKIISCSKDKTFIVWDIKNTSPVKVFNNYFNHLCLLGDNVGFCCGSYDNKIRFYDSDYLLMKCLVSEIYGINLILMIDDYYMLTVDFENRINVLDLYNNNLVFVYTGCTEEVVKVIKAFNWDLDDSENKIIVTACKDGYVYLYSFELEIRNNKVNSEKKYKKEIKNKDKNKDKNKEKDKEKDKQSKKSKSKNKDRKSKGKK